MDIVEMKMPFGRYKVSRLADLPEPYLVWFSQKDSQRQIGTTT